MKALVALVGECLVRCPMTGAAVPGVADDAADDVAFALHHRQRLEEFALVEQQALVVDAGVDDFFDTLAHGR